MPLVAWTEVRGVHIANVETKEVTTLREYCMERFYFEIDYKSDGSGFMVQKDNWTLLEENWIGVSSQMVLMDAMGYETVLLE